jgi:hypothetical protein
VYLPRYCIASARDYAASDEEITNEFLAGLRIVHPDLTTKDIEASFVFREPFVQPILAAGRSFEASPRTPVEAVYLANTSMIRNTTLNNNGALALAEMAAAAVLEDCAAVRKSPNAVQSGAGV